MKRIISFLTWQICWVLLWKIKRIRSELNIDDEVYNEVEKVAFCVKMFMDSVSEKQMLSQKIKNWGGFENIPQKYW
jgi:hypothetical protein